MKHVLLILMASLSYKAMASNGGTVHFEGMIVNTPCNFVGNEYSCPRNGQKPEIGKIVINTNKKISIDENSASYTIKSITKNAKILNINYE